MNPGGNERTPDLPPNRYTTAEMAFVCQPAFHPVYWFVLSQDYRTEPAAERKLRGGQGNFLTARPFEARSNRQPISELRRSHRKSVKGRRPTHDADR